MLSRRLTRLVLVLTLLPGGCARQFQTDPDAVACQLATRPMDLRPVQDPAATGGTEESQMPSSEPKPQATLKPIPVPPEVPGADVPPIDLRKLTPAQRQEAIDRLLPPLPAPGGNPQPFPSQIGRPLELSDLQSLAMANSPLIKQAAADVQAARGAMIQAGAYPNPNIGFEGDAIGQGNAPTERVTPGQLGGFVEQTIKTKGKLRLARAAAEEDLRNSEYALRRAQLDVMTQVRGGYFAVLAARENMRVALAFARFNEEVYRIQVGQLRGGEVAAYEPLQFRALAVQARATLAQARHRYVSAWKQLTAAMGVPGLPPAPLAGSLDMPIPTYRYDDVATRVLARHTDVLTARATLERARYNLRLAQVTPCPDIDVRVVVQKDYTGDPHNVMTGVQVGGPVPVWNRNQGNILQAEAQLVRASEEEHRVRDDLARQLADVFERYNLNRELLSPYRGTVLPDLVRVLNGVFERYLAQSTKTAGEITFLDISTAQQNLATAVMAYLQALAAHWQALVDIGGLLQTEDLFQMGGEPAPLECLPPLPNLDRLLPLPCHHPCSPLADPALREAVDQSWPAALPQPPAARRNEPYPER
jgi:cobalt-zinc-cadmium efflux system outer membrane protein